MNLCGEFLLVAGDRYAKIDLFTHHCSDSAWQSRPLKHEDVSFDRAIGFGSDGGLLAAQLGESAAECLPGIRRVMCESTGAQ